MLRTVNGRYGPCTVFEKDQYVGRSVIAYGEYNPDECEFIVSLATAGKKCLDIGANLGCISQALEFAGHEVIAFEPQTMVYNECLIKNVTRGTCFNVALGAETGVAQMPKIHYSDKNNIGGMGIGMSSQYGVVEVPVRTLDSYNIYNIGLIKIDVEGFEEQVLIGGRETILRERPIMYIEDDRAEKSNNLRKYITSLGYRFEEHMPPLFRPSNFFNNSKNIWDRNYVSKNIVCYPN